MLRAALFLLAASAPGVPATEPGASPAELLDDALQRLDRGRFQSTELDPDTAAVAIYFGAGWCPPCRAFMPELKTTYARWREEGRPIEIVFVSDDPSCRAMEDYARRTRMPWPIVSCRMRERVTEVQRMRTGPLPGMVVLDADGRIIASSYERDSTDDYADVLRKLDRR